MSSWDSGFDPRFEIVANYRGKSYKLPVFGMSTWDTPEYCDLTFYVHVPWDEGGDPVRLGHNSVTLSAKELMHGSVREFSQSDVFDYCDGEQIVDKIKDKSPYRFSLRGNEWVAIPTGISDIVPLPESFVEQLVNG